MSELLMAEIVDTMNMISAGNPTMTDASMDSSSIKLSFDDRMYSNRFDRMRALDGVYPRSMFPDSLVYIYLEQTSARQTYVDMTTDMIH